MASERAFSSASRDTRGDPRSAVISLSGDVSCSGGGGAFLRGETFLAIDLRRESGRTATAATVLGVADLTLRRLVASTGLAAKPEK